MTVNTHCELCGCEFTDDEKKSTKRKYCRKCAKDMKKSTNKQKHYKNIQAQESLTTAIMTANKLGISYGQYMLLTDEEKKAMNDAIDARQHNIIAKGTTETDTHKNTQVLDNQDIKSDAGKLRISLVPMEIVRNIAKVRMYGTNKYGDKESWKEVSVNRYIDALDRHTLLFNDNPYGLDEESGLPHLWHIACNTAFLCDLMKGEFEL